MRLLGTLIGAYVLTAVVTRLAEEAGLRRCGCTAACWCKTQSRSVFRWVFPFGHQSFDPHEKERLANA